MFDIMHYVLYSYDRHNNQQMHIKLLKIPHYIYNSYMLQRQGSIFGEFKIQRRVSTCTIFLMLR